MKAIFKSVVHMFSKINEKYLCMAPIITLHYSYLAWFKYKTAKPLIYTVYRTKPKTVRKEMIRKREVLRRFQKTLSRSEQ